MSLDETTAVLAEKETSEGFTEDFETPPFEAKCSGYKVNGKVMVRPHMYRRDSKAVEDSTGLCDACFAITLHYEQQNGYDISRGLSDASENTRRVFKKLAG